MLPNSLGMLLFPFFFLSEIIYCWWKIWDQNLYKIVSFLHGANVRPPCTHPVASPYYLRAVLSQITVCQFISLVPGPFSVAKLTNSRTIYFLLSKGLAITDIYKHWGPVQRHRHVVTEPTAKKKCLMILQIAVYNYTTIYTSKNASLQVPFLNLTF